MLFETKKILIIAMFTVSFAFAPIYGLNAQPAADGNRTAALMELLKQKGIFNDQDMKTLKDKISGGEASLEALIDMLRDKQIITHQETKQLNAVSFRAGERTTDGLGDEAREISTEESGVTKKEFNTLTEELKTDRDRLLVKPRQNEREIQRLEKNRIDPLFDRMRKTAWAESFSLDGDMRMRFQGDFYDAENGLFLKPENPTALLNTTEDRKRLRARIRLNAKADLIDGRDVNVGKVTAKIRLSGGNEKNPVSTNETMGDYFNKDSIVLDRYFLQWQYKPTLEIWGKMPRITLTGGRMPTPWFSSDLVWDDDLNFEGLAFTLQSDTLEENKWHVFLTGGAFPLQEVELSDDDKWLYGAQLGVGAAPVYGLDVRLGVGYYWYENIVGKVNDPLTPGLYDYSAPLYQQKGNTLIDIDPTSTIKTALASDFKILDITGKVDLTYFFPVHIVFDGTYALNMGFDKKEVAERTGIANIEEDNRAYLFGAKVGYPSITQFSEWNFSYHYKYIEADAVLDAFTDSDFHLGGTNTKGWIAGLEYGLYKNVWLKARWLTSDEIKGPPLAIDVFQVDLNARF